MQRSGSIFTSILLSFCFILLSFSSAIYGRNVEAGIEAPQLSSEFDPSINVNNVLAISTEFDKTLFAQQANSPIPLPAANHIMLSLLVIEQLNLEESITVSANAIAFGEQDPKNHTITIEQNETYLVSTLLALHMYEHSYTAALALAEKLAGTVAACVELMNQKAKHLDMQNTNFTNLLGFVELKNNATWSQDFNLIEDAHLLIQKSTLNDMSNLVTTFLKNQTAEQLFSQREYYTRLPDSMIALHHPFDQVFSAVDQGVTGAWNLKQNEMSFSLIIGEQNHIKYLIMMTDKTRNTFTKTMVDLVQDIVDYYTVTPLVSQGKAYPGTDQTKQGDKIELIFLKTINYIHPVADNFLHPAVKYVSHGPHSRPLPRGSTVGHVVFTLNDGDQIQAEVGSSESILSGNTLLSRLFNSLQQNPNLSNLIIILTLLLCIIIFIRIIKLIRELANQIRLYRLNSIQKKLKDRINKS